MQKFSLATENFQGPLEVLLDMIEGRKMSISDISLADVTDAYLAYVETLPQLPLGETAQFILVASTLLLIKSRALLPELELSEDERESVQELERRLARLRLIRQTAKTLRKEWGKAPLVLAKRAPSREAVFTPSDASVPLIFAAANKLLSILPKPEAMARAAVAPVIALEDVIAHVRARLTSAFRAKFSELTKSRDRNETIVYFLAMLELVRSGSASVSQEKLYADITIEIENIADMPSFGARV